MLEKFIRFIEKHQLFTQKETILVGVSGGVDSVVLCHLLNEAQFKFAIAHVNFGLRGGESDADDIFVQGLAEHYQVPHYRMYANTKKIAAERGISIEMAARDIRYDWFEKIRSENGYDAIVTGAHLNDQIETFLLNFSKGTGITGLTGIAPNRGFIKRPLLEFTRKEIEQYAQEKDLSFRIDQSNADITFQRNRIRHEVIPQLKTINPSLEETFKNTMHNLKSANRFLEAAAESELKKLVQKNKASLVDFQNPEKEILLYYWLSPFGFQSAQLNQILESNSEESGKKFISSTHILWLNRGELILEEYQESNQPEEIEISIEMSSTTWGNQELVFETVDASKYTIKKDSSWSQLDFDKLEFPLTIRTWKEGDSFVPLGLGGKKKLSDFFIDKKIPLNQKGNIPVVLSKDEIVCVVGLQIDDRYKLVEDSKKAYLIHSIPNL